MKKNLLLLGLCFCTLLIHAQNASVEKSVFGIQTGFLGIWLNNESRLSNSIALRSELGIEGGFGISSNSSQNFFMTAPVITLEPRWYYNLKKRKNKSKRIAGNSGNFIALKTSYHPDILITSNNDNVVLISDISIVPTWGIRRHIGNHFNYEAGFGVGYLHYFEKENVIIINESNVAVNLHLRIGYRF